MQSLNEILTELENVDNTTKNKEIGRASCRERV